MRKINKVIFVCMDNLCRSPMAESIMKNIIRDRDITIESKGLVVLFPEPYNLRARSILLNNEIIMSNGTATQLSEADFSDDTLILTMDRDEKQKIQEEFSNSYNVFTIMEFAGGSGNIMDPYGGDWDVYNLFYESITSWVTQAEEKIHEINMGSEEENEQ